MLHFEILTSFLINLTTLNDARTYEEAQFSVSFPYITTDFIILPCCFGKSNTNNFSNSPVHVKVLNCALGAFTVT